MTRPTVKVTAPIRAKPDVIRRRRSRAARESTARNVRGDGARGDGSSRCSNIIYSFRSPSVQVVAQGGESSRSVGLYGADRHGQGDGDVSLGPVGQIAQHHHLSLSSGEPSQRPGQIDPLGLVGID
jgi:hypothetical protein